MVAGTPPERGLLVSPISAAPGYTASRKCHTAPSPREVVATSRGTGVVFESSPQCSFRASALSPASPSSSGVSPRGTTTAITRSRLAAVQPVGTPQVIPAERQATDLHPWVSAGSSTRQLLPMQTFSRTPASNTPWTLSPTSQLVLSPMASRSPGAERIILTATGSPVIAVGVAASPAVVAQVDMTVPIAPSAAATHTTSASSATSPAVASPCAATPLAARSVRRIRTLDVAMAQLPQPMGVQEVMEQDRPPTDSRPSMLDEDQVKSCTCILLSSLLTSEASTNVWPTTFTYLEMIAAGAIADDERARVQEWLKRRPNLVIYIITCIVRDGSRPGPGMCGGHIICISVDLSNESWREEATVFDSGRSAECRRRLGDTARQAISLLASVKETPAPERPPRYQVHRSDQAPMSCGFHVALFIAEDCTWSKPERTDAPRRFRRLRAAWTKPGAATRVLQLRNCPDDAERFRLWLAHYTKSGAYDSIEGWVLNREKQEEAFQELVKWATRGRTPAWAQSQYPGGQMRIRSVFKPFSRQTHNKGVA